MLDLLCGREPASCIYQQMHTIEPTVLRSRSIVQVFCRGLECTMARLSSSSQWSMWNWRDIYELTKTNLIKFLSILAALVKFGATCELCNEVCRRPGFVEVWKHSKWLVLLSWIGGSKATDHQRTSTGNIVVYGTSIEFSGDWGRPWRRRVHGALRIANSMLVCDIAVCHFPVLSVLQVKWEWDPSKKAIGIGDEANEVSTGQAAGYMKPLYWFLQTRHIPARIQETCLR